VSTTETVTATEIYRLVDTERFRQASELAKNATEADPRLTIARANLAVFVGDGELDDAILSLEALLERNAELPTDDRAIAYGLLVRAYGYKRAFATGAKWAARGREAVGPHVELLCAEARLALWRDDRDRAAELSAEARRFAPESTLARYVDADLAYVVGDFARCHATLDPIPTTSPDWLRGARLRAAAYAAVQDHAGELKTWEEIVELGAHGDRASEDRIAYAIALAANDRRGEALEQLREVWRRDPDSPLGRYAWKRIEALETALAHPENAPRKALSFPSTQQKRDYCGPAVLELCLRSLGIEITQDDIATTVKRENGTPMHAIVTFLENNGVVARRVAATATRLKSAIDLGLPVILQEEYSTTSHVAVLTGYDAGLGLFITSDPATHRPTYKPFTWTEAAGDLFGNGAVVVLGRAGDAATEELAARCDAADLVAQEHLAVLDDCDRRRAAGPLAGAADAILEEIVRISERAIELEPRFKLAWYRKWRALEGLAVQRGTPDARSRALEGLFEIRTRFRDDEWPYQLHASWLMRENRFDEAFVQFLEASSRDPGDGNNVEGMGYARAIAGDLAAGERYLLRSLRLSPESASAHIRLADVYVRQLESLDAELDDAEQRRLVVRSNIEVTHAIERAKEEILARAVHYATLGRELAPNDVYVHELLGILALRTARAADAVTSFELATKLAPGRLVSVRGLAFACEAAGDADRAESLLSAITADADPTTWLALADVLTRREKSAEAIAELSKAIVALEYGRNELAEPLFALMREHEGTETAAGKLRALAERRATDGVLQRVVAAQLNRANQRGHAIAIFRNALAAAPADVMLAFRLGTLLASNLTTRNEASALLERVVEHAPDWPHGRRELALLLYTSDPARALAVLEPVLDAEEPYTLETYGVVLEKLGRIDDAQRAWQRAVQAYEDPSTAALAYCDWHGGHYRFERAIALSRTFVDAEGKCLLEPELEERAQREWVSTMRLAGRMAEALPAVRAIIDAKGGAIPKHLAYDIYWGTGPSDAELGARAAAVLREAEEDEGDKLAWKIRESGKRAKAGDSTMLDSISSELPDDADRWAELSWEYSGNDRHPEADAAAEKAYAIDPRNHDALKAMENRAVHNGRLAFALECAHKLLELHPYEHAGPERLGILLAKSMRAEEAVEHAARAVDAAPYCHIAQRSAALAYFVAGRLDLAMAYAKQSLALSPPDEDDPDSDAAMILRAIERDVPGLERCFVTRSKDEPTPYFPAFDARLREVAARA
jgi:tetratricopeptide (TPR) repeat protein